ncbi:MAG: hypothetical protein H7Z74_09885 [Anaerolineae bacterium]|nr:hypothetical protein [Gemmatimonadaceae bacterium]
MRPDHPALGGVQHHALISPNHPAIAQIVEEHGSAATAAAIESMLIVLLELLGRLIGDDMAAKIAENSAKNGAG